MPCPCSALAVPLPCRAAKGLECLSHLIYTVRPCLIHTCHAMPMPCSDHAVLLKATAQHVRRETACGLPARVRLLPTTTRSFTKVVIRSITISGTAVAQWLRCYATNRMVAGSIPAGVSGFFIDIKSFRSHYGPGIDSASNRNEYQEYFLG